MALTGAENPRASARLPGGACAARLVFRPEYERYDFGPEHPLTPRRMQSSLDLMAAAALGPAPGERLELPAASDEQLRLVHREAYVASVKRLSLFADDPMIRGEAAMWGLGPGDSPAFPGMHEAAAAIAGGTLGAIEGVLSGQFDHAFNPAGGLHHALTDRASGFCIYNDAAIGIAAALQAREARVLYLDFDAHHGDGVQAAFYDDPRVLTFSIHETGRHLFPGTGSVYELGEGLGRGYSLNLPVEPFTQDGSWLASLDLLLPSLVEWFAPDIVVSQHGCDSHTWDPLTHLNLSTRAYARQAQLVHQLAHQFCAGRWVALGGGGYDWIRVVPRSWSIVWAEMSGRPLPGRLPPDWTQRWSAQAEENDFTPMVEDFLDQTDDWRTIPREAEIERENRVRAETLRLLAVPALLRHAYPAYRPDVQPRDLSDVVAELGGTRIESRAAVMETPRGPVNLRDACPASFVERLQPDPGLVSFTGRAETEHRLLARIASDATGSVSVAHTAAGVLVSQIVIAPGESWWQGLPGAYEISMETSRPWRGTGVARALVEFTMAAPWVEHLILFGTGLVWQWKLEPPELDEHGYGQRIRRLMARVGFKDAATREPNVAMHPGNLFLVRVGSQVSPSRLAAFEEALVVPPQQRRSR